MPFSYLIRHIYFVVATCILSPFEVPPDASYLPSHSHTIPSLQTSFLFAQVPLLSDFVSSPSLTSLLFSCQSSTSPAFRSSSMRSESSELCDSLVRLLRKLTHCYLVAFPQREVLSLALMGAGGLPGRSPSRPSARSSLW